MFTWDHCMVSSILLLLIASVAWCVGETFPLNIQNSTVVLRGSVPLSQQLLKQLKCPLVLLGSVFQLGCRGFLILNISSSKSTELSLIFFLVFSVRSWLQLRPCTPTAVQSPFCPVGPVQTGPRAAAWPVSCFTRSQACYSSEPHSKQFFSQEGSQADCNLEYVRHLPEFMVVLPDSISFKDILIEGQSCQ